MRLFSTLAEICFANGGRAAAVSLPDRNEPEFLACDEAAEPLEATMSLFQSAPVRVAAITAMTASFCIVVAVQANSYSSSARLQELADGAALAGVSSLASSVGQPDVERRAASIAVSQDVIAIRPNIVSKISPSPDGSRMSVIVRDMALGKQTSSTAQYVGPSADAPSRQSSNMSLHAPINGAM
jgi:hypothetical protein